MSIQKEAFKQHLPQDLYLQIEQLLESFNDIRQAAAGISSNHDVPDSSMELRDVLQHTEDAAETIIDTATDIQSIVDASGADDAVKQQVGEKVTAMYEACNFQDISGQRIKKVMGKLVALEEKLQGLAQLAEHYGVDKGNGAEHVATNGVSSDADLLNGPQLSEHVPSQAEVDALFSST